MGLKFLRDGMDSASLVAMYSVDGQPSWNFFLNDFSNHIPDITSLSLKVVGEKFSTASDLSRVLAFLTGPNTDKPVLQ